MRILRIDRIPPDLEGWATGNQNAVGIISSAFDQEPMAFGLIHH